MRSQFVTRIAVALLALAMVFTMMPLMPATAAYAEEETDAVVSSESTPAVEAAAGSVTTEPAAADPIVSEPAGAGASDPAGAGVSDPADAVSAESDAAPAEPAAVPAESGTGPAKGSPAKIMEDPAAEYDLWLGETRVTAGNKDDILGDGTASYDPATRTLTLNDPVITGTKKDDFNRTCKIYANGIDLTVTGTARIAGAQYGICVNEGALTLDGGDIEASGSYCAFRADGTVAIKSGTVTAKDGERGIMSGDGDVLITGGTLTASGSSYGVWGGYNVVVKGGEVTVTAKDYGIYGFEGGLIVEGGKLTTTAHGGSVTGVSGIRVGRSGITIRGGEVTTTGDSYGIYTGSTGGRTTVTGGTLTATGSNIGIGSPVFVSGSDTVVTAIGSNSFGISVPRGYDVNVTGGTLHAEGSTGGIRMLGGETTAGDLSFKNANVDIKGKNGIVTEKTLAIADSHLTITAENDDNASLSGRFDEMKTRAYGIQALNGITINDSTVTITAANNGTFNSSGSSNLYVDSYGMRTAGTLAIKGSDVNIIATNDSAASSSGSGTVFQTAEGIRAVTLQIEDSRVEAEVTGAHIDDALSALNPLAIVSPCQVVSPANAVILSGGGNATVYESDGTTVATHVVIDDGQTNHTVTYKIENGTWADGTTEDITVTTRGGKTPANVPQGMIANEGCGHGAWDPDPAATTVSEDTTFTYRFAEVNTLTLHWSSVDGDDLMDPVVIGDIVSGTSIEDVLFDEGYTSSDTPFEKAGYRSLTWDALLPESITAYTSDSEMRAARVDPGTPVTEDTVLYVPMYKLLDVAELTVEAPLCGTSTTTDQPASPWNDQTNPPVIAVPEGAPYHLNTEGDTHAAWWIDPAAGRAYIGDFEAGQEYQLQFSLSCDYGYKFAVTENGIFVEGGDLVRKTSSSVEEYLEGIVEVTAAHAPGAPETVTKATLTEDGTTVTKCSGCGQELSTGTISHPKTFKLSAESYTYDGKVKKPTVKVTDTNGKTIASSNYSVTYASGRKNVGKYSVKITFKDTSDYSGTKTLYFKINPKGTTIKSVTAASKAATVKWTKQSTKMSTSYISGYQIMLATNSKFTTGKKTVNVAGYSKVSKKVTGLTGGKKYYVKIRTYKTVSGVKYYSPWSKAKTVTTKK